MPVVAATTVYQWLFAPRFGVVNWVLDKVGCPLDGGLQLVRRPVLHLLRHHPADRLAVDPVRRDQPLRGHDDHPQRALRGRRASTAPARGRASPRCTFPFLSRSSCATTFLEIIWVFKAFPQVFAINAGRPRPAHRDPAGLRVRRGRRQPALRHGRGDLDADHPHPARPDRPTTSVSFSSKRRTSCEALPDRPGSGPTRRPSSSSSVFVFPVYWMFATALQADRRHHRGRPGLFSDRHHLRRTSRRPSTPTTSGRWSATRSPSPSSRWSSPSSSRCSRPFALARMRFKGTQGLHPDAS